MPQHSIAMIDLGDLFDSVFFREDCGGFASTFYLRMGEPDQTEVIIFAHKAGITGEKLLANLAAACVEWTKAGAVEIDDKFLEKLEAALRGPV